MAVTYIRVNPEIDMFSPVIRPTGNVAIVGAATSGTENVPVQVTSPSKAAETFGAPVGSGTNAGSELTRALQLAFVQTPGPAQLWGVKSAADPTAALAAVEGLDVQFVLLANTPVTATTAGANGSIAKLAAHVRFMSAEVGEGKERMGVAMLAKGATDASVVNPVADERMIYIAHRSDQDVAAAVAGTVAGYDPSVSMLLKQVAVDSAQFTAAEIETINGQERFGTGPAGKGVNWLVSPSLIPGGGIYLGEGYTGNPNGMKFIDVVRVVDDVSFKLKARLIKSIGSLRIGRSGLRSLKVLMEAVLEPIRQDGVIDTYRITVPVLDLLDADEAVLTDLQRQQIKDARNNRLVEVRTEVTYAGAVHRIAITLKFS